MTKPVLVLVHGRAQGGKEEGALRDIWLDTLRDGLGAARRDRLEEVEVRFPFYGDLLDQLVAQSGRAPLDVMHRGGDTTGIDPDYAAFQLEIAEDARQSRAITDDQILDHMPPGVTERGPLQWGWVQGILRTLEHVPGLSGDMLERFTRDVWVYLTDDHVRETINAKISEAIRPGERLVVVGHSLGTVVAFDVMRKAQGLDVPLYLTVGSPLAQRTIRSRLTPLKRPPAVTAWFNAFDERDVVALYPLDAQNFNVSPPIENYSRVQNGTDNAHGIIGYLNDATVADQIYRALFE